MVLCLPVYLEQDTAEFRKDQEKGLKFQLLYVNEWIRKDIAIVETIMAK